MFILASGSPRRRELLQQIGAEFRVEVSESEELLQAVSPGELVRLNAVAKAEAVALRHPGEAVLGADTVVALEGRIYGKPKDAAEACAMLAALSGRRHEVLTGIAWACGGRTLSEAVSTQVQVAELTAEEISRYVATGEPLDKAGAYAVQGGAAVFIEGIQGSYSNVVGLPLYRTALLAKKAGVDLYGKGGSSEAGSTHGQGSAGGGAPA